MLLTCTEKPHDANQKSLAHGLNLNDFFPNIKQEC